MLSNHKSTEKRLIKKNRERECVKGVKKVSKRERWMLVLAEKLQMLAGVKEGGGEVEKRAKLCIYLQ